MISSQNEKRVGSHQFVAENGQSDLDGEISAICKITFKLVPISGITVKEIRSGIGGISEFVEDVDKVVILKMKTAKQTHLPMDISAHTECLVFAFRHFDLDDIRKRFEVLDGFH